MLSKIIPDLTSKNRMTQRPNRINPMQRL